MNKRAINEFRNSGKLKQYQDLIESDKKKLTNAEYNVFLQRQEEILDVQAEIRKHEQVLEYLYDRLLVLKEA